jgi:hypothetical protein
MLSGIVARRWMAITMAVATAGVLMGCSVNANVDATGAAPPSTAHLALTVEEVWFAPAADTLPEATSGWYKQTLPTPITLDLATMTPGTLVSLASALKVPAGTYSQVHFVLAESTDALTATAQALSLLYNTQLSLISSTGVISDFPLELPVPESGITIPVDLDLTGSFGGLGGLGGLGSSTTSDTSTGTSATTTTAANSTTGTTGTTDTTATTSATGTTGTVTTVSIAALIDASRDVLSYTYGSNVGYILSPVTNAAEESKAGAISGTIDVGALAADGPPVWVSAEAVDSTSTHHRVVARSLVGTNGTFVLYPLPAPKNGTTYYDVVITCAAADTTIIKGVPVTAASISAPTSISTATIPLAVAPTAYADVSPNNAPLPGGARVAFYQTVPVTGEIPYEIDSVAVDPVLLRLPGDAFGLSSGPLLVGSYTASSTSTTSSLTTTDTAATTTGGSISFTTLAPSEGDGGYLVGSEGLYRADTLAGTSTVINGTAAAPTELSVPLPAVAAGGVTGNLTITIASTAGSYDSGFLLVSSGDRVVESASIPSLLAAGGGTVTLSLPAGSALAAPSGVPYQVAIRAWSSANPTSTLVRVAGANSVNLGDSGAAAVSVQVP